MKRLVRLLVWGDPPTWPLLSRRSVRRIPYTATAIKALIPSISSYKYINTCPIQFIEELLCTPNFSFLYEVDCILLGIRPHAIFFHITSQASDNLSNNSIVCVAKAFFGIIYPKDHFPWSSSPRRQRWCWDDLGLGVARWHARSSWWWLE